MMETDRQAQLSYWISQQHQGQMVKRTTRPYFEHLQTVAEMAAPFAELGFEVGLCHDLLEKTSVAAKDFYRALVRFGYQPDEADVIHSQVTELTDVYHKTAYPDLNKQERKELEARRLAEISPGAQTVKYADLIDNIAWVQRYDPNNAGRYLARKKTLLLSLNRGNPLLRREALHIISKRC